MIGSVVCTLFEGHYHYGVASLINSLVNNGFKGEIYAGYKGDLPFWANKAVPNNKSFFENTKSFYLSEEVTLHFIPLKANVHFTNYKPQFALDLFKNINHIKGVFYFDPDIVVKCNWQFYENWITYGVAVVHEITNHDMPENHPVRRQWEAIGLAQGYRITNRLQSYINAGFFGLIKENISFLLLYIKFIAVSVELFGADLDQLKFSIDRSDPFYARDQDALNIAAMCCEAPLSEYGPEAMDFINGGKVMSHAIGPNKPWKKNFLSSALRAFPPSTAEKEYWNHANGIINPYSKTVVKRKNFFIKTASFIGRFYRKY